MEDNATLSIENIGNKIYITLTNAYHGGHTTSEYVFIDLLKFITIWKRLRRSEGVFVRLQTICDSYAYEKWIKLKDNIVTVAYGKKDQKTEKGEEFEPDFQFDLKLTANDLIIMNAISTMDKQGIKDVRHMVRYNPRP